MERGPVYVRVEIDGREGRRQAEPLHLCDSAGQLVATALRPMVLPGEQLVERLGTYPKIVREKAMIDLAVVYRDQMVRAVLGPGPAILAKEANTTALDRMAARLADAEAALEQLRAKGYGTRGQTLAEVAYLIPATPERAAQQHDIWGSR